VIWKKLGLNYAFERSSKCDFQNTTIKRALPIPLVFIGSTEDTQNSSSPIILFVFCNDLSSAELRFFHKYQEINPSTETLSIESAVFTNANFKAPLFGPSRASVFIGVHHVISGYNQSLYDWRHNELPSAATIFQHFKTNSFGVFASGKIFRAQQNPSGDFTLHHFAISRFLSPRQATVV